MADLAAICRVSMSAPPPEYNSVVADAPFDIENKHFDNEGMLLPVSAHTGPTSQAISHLPPKPLRKIPPPVPLPLNHHLRHEGNALPTPFPYDTPAATPYTTAPNTPMFLSGGAPAFSNMLMPSGHPVMAPQMMLNPYNAIPMQQFAFPSAIPPTTSQPAPQANGGINLVVNANSNSNAEGGDGFGISPDGQKMKICPNCHKGLIVRDQNRRRARKIKFFAFLTSCCLFCLPCCLLRCNFVDQCRACRVNYGKTGGRKNKKPKYA